MAASGDVDVRPSSQEMDQISGCTAQIDNEGSKFDCDFDDEFNLDEFVASAGVGWDIADNDELN